MPQRESIEARYQIVPLTFALVDLADSQTATAVPVAGASTVATHATPFSGWIRGYVIRHSAAATAGVLTFAITVGGTTIGVTINAATASTVTFRGNFGREQYRFATGALIGVTYTSDANLEPNTMDTHVTVLVAYDTQ
jgi:hypothetical protein